MSIKYFVISIVKKIKTMYKKVILREKRYSNGNEYSDKVFYVVRHASDKVGLFAYVMCAAAKIMYAMENGYIPIVDMQNYANPYLEKGRIGKDNAWEFFYEQPMGYSLNDIKNAKNIIISDAMIPENRPTDSMDFINNEDLVKKWQVFFEKYIRINNNLKLKMDAEVLRIIGNNRRVLGVSLRGTDYVALKPYQHPIQPTIEQAIKKTKDVFDEKSYDAIYLATEDEEIYTAFQKEFGKLLLSSERKRYANIGREYVTRVGFDRENDAYLKGVEYLTNIYLLTCCDALIAGRAGGSIAALIMGKKYEYTYFFDLGYYGIDDK